MKVDRAVRRLAIAEGVKKLTVRGKLLHRTVVSGDKHIPARINEEAMGRVELAGVEAVVSPVEEKLAGAIIHAHAGVIDIYDEEPPLTIELHAMSAQQHPRGSSLLAKDSGELAVRAEHL